MREFKREVTIEADGVRVWRVLADVEAWATWTASVSNVVLLSEKPIGVGSLVRLKQPKLQAATWTVTRWEPDKGFAWESRTSGVKVTADHDIRPIEGGCEVGLRLRFEGWLAPIIAALGGNLTREYMRLEAEGLKRQVEST